MTMLALFQLELHSASGLKQKSTGRHIATLRHRKYQSYSLWFDLTMAQTHNLQ